MYLGPGDIPINARSGWRVVILDSATCRKFDSSQLVIDIVEELIASVVRKFDLGDHVVRVVSNPGSVPLIAQLGKQVSVGYGVRGVARASRPKRLAEMFAIDPNFRLNRSAKSSIFYDVVSACGRGVIKCSHAAKRVGDSAYAPLRWCRAGGAVIREGQQIPIAVAYPCYKVVVYAITSAVSQK